MAARILPSPDPSGGNRSTKASNKLPGLTSEAMAADLKALRQQVEAVEKSRMDWRLADAMSQNMTLAMKKLKLELHGTVQATLQERLSRPSFATSSATHKGSPPGTECDAKHATAHSDRDAAAARAAAEEEEARRHKAEVEAIKAAADEAAIAAAAAAGATAAKMEKANVRRRRRGVCCLERRKRTPYRCSSAYWRPRSAPTLQWRG